MRWLAIPMILAGIFLVVPAFAQSEGACQKHDALTVAWNRVGEVYDSFTKKKRPIAILDKKTYWHVYWSLPPGVAGGSPELHIDKRDCKILRIYHSQ